MLVLSPLLGIASFKISQLLNEKYPSSTITVFYVAAFMLATCILYVFATMARILLADKAKFRNWLKIPIKQVTAEELLRLLCLYQSTEYSRRLVITIRERNALIASEVSENLITELALALDTKIRSKSLPSDFAASEFFRSWLEKYTRKYR